MNVPMRTSLSISLPFAGNKEREQLEQSSTGRCDVFLLSSVPSSFSFLLPRLDGKQRAVQRPSRAAVVSFLTSVRRSRNYTHTFSFFPFSPLLSRSAPLSYLREDAHAETCTARLSHAHRRARLSARRNRCYVHGGLKETETRQSRPAAQLPRATPSLRSCLSSFLPVRALPFSAISFDRKRRTHDWREKKLIKPRMMQGTNLSRIPVNQS